MRTRTLVLASTVFLRLGAGALPVLIAAALLIACADPSGTEGSETGDACAQSDLIAQCPAGSSPLLGATSASLCGGQSGVDLLNASGEVSGRCVGSGQCIVACQFSTPCRCGVAAVTREGVFCVPCDETSVCGNGVCEGGESPESCAQDCSTECSPGQERCASLRAREVCNLRGAWETVACQPTEICDRLQDAAVCRRSDLLAGFDDLVVDDEEPPLPGRILPDRGEYPGTGTRPTPAAAVSLTRVAVRTFCSRSENREDCAFTQLDGFVGSGNRIYSESMHWGAGPGDRFVLSRFANQVSPGFMGPPTPHSGSLVALDANADPLDEPAPLDLLPPEGPRLSASFVALAAGATHAAQIVSQDNLAVDTEGDNLLQVDDRLVVIDLATHEVNEVWRSGTRFAESAMQLTDTAERVWLLSRFQGQSAWVAADGISRPRMEPAGPRVLTLVDVAADSVRLLPQLQGLIHVAIDDVGAVGAFVSDTSPAFLELWNLDTMERIWTLRSEPPNFLIQRVWLTGQPDRMLVDAGSLEVWDLRAQQLITRFALPGRWSLSPSGTEIAHLDDVREVLELIDVETGDVLTSFPLDSGLEGAPAPDGDRLTSLTAPVFSGDGSHILVELRWGASTAYRTIQTFEVGR